MENKVIPRKKQAFLPHIKTNGEQDRSRILSYKVIKLNREHRSIAKSIFADILTDERN